MLDEQDQLNRILRTKYLETAIEEVSEPELIVDNFGERPGAKNCILFASPGDRRDQLGSREDFNTS